MINKNSMKLFFTLTASLLVILTGKNAAASETTRVLEIHVEGVMAPPSGYDDNDNIQVVLHGYLPNACYKIAYATAEGQGGGESPIRVRQYAYRELTGYCAQDAEIPPHLQMLIPFTTELSLGQLPSGDHSFTFSGIDGNLKSRTVNVMRALSPSVDERPYAAVSNASVPEVTNGAASIKVTVNGILNSSCTELEAINIKRERDVFVVLPILKVKPNVLCAQVLIPFQRTLELGRQKPGHYLIHVRSMNGRSVNRVTEVVR